MNVLYLYDGHWPHNATRVSKEIETLIAAGHSTTILSRGKRRDDDDRRAPSLRVSRMPSAARTGVDRLLSYPVFVNPVWVWQIWREARATDADCIIVRDLPLAPAALVVGRLAGVPVHYDMAEVYPVALHTLLPHEAGFAILLVRATHLAETVERLVVRRATTTFVVSEESRLRCVSLGVPADRVVLVGNTTANADELAARWPIPTDIADLADKPIALFVGNVFADRGLRYAIEAMSVLAAERPDAVLVIVGDGRERARLQELVDSRGLGQRVRFLGWKHHRDHAAYLAHAQLGLLPFMKTAHICITLANKLFDYMAAGLPVLASDVPPMRRVLEETQSGLLVEPGDADALAAALIRLF